MEFTSTTCPACNKHIQIPTGASQAICMYCGSRFLPESGLTARPAAGTDNLLGMARSALASGNHAESESYFNRVLELNPGISEAWVGKGLSAGWQSTIAHMRFPEVITCFSHAIANTTDPEKRETVDNCVLEINKLVAAIYSISRNHMIEYAAVPDTWSQYVSNTSEMLTVLETARNWTPLDRTTLENIVHLCKDNIEGISFRDQFDRNLPKAWTVSHDYENDLRTKMGEASDALKQLDPSYQPPQASPKKPDACFVVTATMGDQDHPTVEFMRQFRDVWLVNQPGGIKFIAWYYKHGPKAADFIAASTARRRFSYALIVRPLAFLASMIMGRRKKCQR